MRSSSYSPPRNERNYDDDSRRRRRSRSRSRSSSHDGSKTQRLAATLIGGLVGGFAGNQFRKGQKYDTAATITGAVLGGIASREIAEKIGGKKEDRKDKRQGEQEAWEREYGDGGRRSGEDDRRRSRR
jgi:outer membrane lipoprotein SlyB